MKIGFTGTQVGMTQVQKESIKDMIEQLQDRIEEVHAGDCIGADKEFIEIVNKVMPNVKTIGHIPDNDSKRAKLKYTEEREPKPYLMRNQGIVDESTVILATPKEREEQQRSGTWFTIRKAILAGLTVCIIFPDGEVTIK